MKKIKCVDGLSARGEVKVFTRRVGETGWNLERHLSNIVVDLGVNLIRDNVFGSQVDQVIRGAVSDDGSAPIAGDTSLGGNEVREEFLPGYPDNVTSKQSLVQYFIDATQWAAASPGAMTAVQKAGLYFRTSGNFLFCAASFNSVGVDNETELLVQWIVIFSDA